MAASALATCFSFLLLAWRLPGGLLGTPVDLKTWADVGRNRLIVLLLLITTLQMSGQFVVFTFMGPLLARLTQAGPDAVGLVFAIYGAVRVSSAIVIATRLVDSWGGYSTSLLVHDVAAGRQPASGRSAPAIFAVMAVAGRDLGSGLRLDQLDAAGAADRCRAGARRRRRCR